MKLYQHLDKLQKQELFDLAITDSQITTIIKNYIEDEHFSGDDDGYINLWNLYNLFTESAKCNYIDNFLGRNNNTYEFVNHLADSIKNHQDSYFLKRMNIEGNSLQMSNKELIELLEHCSPDIIYVVSGRNKIIKLKTPFKLLALLNIGGLQIDQIVFFTELKSPILAELCLY